jgi:hypothetical protein
MRRGRILGILVAVGSGVAGCAHPASRFALNPRVVAIDAVPRSLRRYPPREVEQTTRGVGALMCAGGDVMLGNNLDSTWALRTYGRYGDGALLPDPEALVAPLGPLVADADVVFVNVEGAIGDGPAPPKCRPGSTRCYAFRQDVRAATALRRLAPEAVVVGNVANNHAMDASAAGFVETVDHLRAAGVRVTGADTLPTLLPLAWGDTLAVLGFSTFSAGPDARDLAGVRRLVARAAARYDVVVVSVHMGAEGVSAQRTRDVTETFAGEDRGNPVAFAETAVDAGASVVFGHGPHVLRAMEWRGDALVVYSLGNLLTHGPFSLEEPLNRGAFVCVRFGSRGGVVQADVRSTRQSRPGIVVPDSTSRAAVLVDSLSALDFPMTGVQVLDGWLFHRVLPVGPVAPSGTRP